MKKLFLTAAIILGFAMGSYAQSFFLNEKETGSLLGRDNFDFYWLMRNELEYDEELQGGLFGHGDFSYFGMSRDGGTFSLCFPGHNFTTNWNGGSQGHDDDLVVPLGSGTLLLMGFGAAYALSKRKKED